MLLSISLSLRQTYGANLWGWYPLLMGLDLWGAIHRRYGVGRVLLMGLRRLTYGDLWGSHGLRSRCM